MSVPPAVARAEGLVALATLDAPAGALWTHAVGLLTEHLSAPAAGYDGDTCVAGVDRAGSSQRHDAPVLVAGEARGSLTTWGADDPYLGRVAAVLSAALTRAGREERLAQRERHFVAAQRISHVGSYDFEISTNTNDWSDQLYRIYGREPGSFMATYERFLELVHPDDRERILAVHQQSLQTLAPYEMEERIVWPDGQVRTLASWGEVVPDDEGRPARMVGICWDITQQKADAEAARRSSERFSQLIQSAPDVVLVVARDGRVVRVNARVGDVLGHTEEDLLGRPVTDIVPAGLAAGETAARRADGRLVQADISTSLVELDGEQVTIAFLRDATERKEHERLALRVHDEEVRRRHALEINDNVVQGLTSVLYLLDLQRPDSAHAAARQTLDAARTMMSDLLARTGTTLVPGELVRRHGHLATLSEGPVAQAAAPGALRVLLADDSPDIRLLLRLALSVENACEVVGEAEDGRQAVQAAQQLQPDVVVLDLSMPVMDGLQAIPELLRVQPELRIVVLSGFDQGRMKQAALDLGAHAYLEKGVAVSELVDVMTGLFPDRPVAPAAPAPVDPDVPDGGLAFDGDMVVHELRTPLTVITGMLTTLRDRVDVLPSATTAEVVAAALRNARQMADLLELVSDARHASHGGLPVLPERVDVARLVRSAVADLCAAHGWTGARVEAPDGAEADVDPVRVRQVLANLLSNAFRYSPAGGPVEVTVSTSDAGVVVEVADSGPGVPPEREAELFGKFARLGQSGPGMGLGLYISRAIARAHGGDLALVHDGSGARFRMTLPARAAQPV